MKDRIKFKVFGWYVCISRRPVRIKKSTENQTRLNSRKRRLAMAGERCEICGRPINIENAALHHRLEVGCPDRNAVENVMVLCLDCHHELQKRPHYHGLAHLEDTTRYDDSEPLLKQEEI